MSVIQRHIWVSGRVQGVGFRASTAVAASDYPGIQGYVRNLKDGRVEAVFQGEAQEVLTLINWCRTGPQTARVTQIEVKEEDPEHSWKGFQIL